MACGLQGASLSWTFVPPDGEPKWLYQRLKRDGSWDEWTPFSENAQGPVYTHLTDLSGVFRVKAVLHLSDSIALERLFTRRVDEEHGRGKIGDPDAFGVADTQFQVDFSACARDFLGSDAHPYDGAVSASYGFPGIPKNKYKCNIFVAHRACQSGASVPKINGRWEWWPRFPPSANQWAGTEDTHHDIEGEQTDIESWILLPSSSFYPQPGFIIAHPAEKGSGHVGIVDYDGEGIGAGVYYGVSKMYEKFYDGKSGFRKYVP